MESHLVLVFISTVLVTAVLGEGVHLELKGTVIPNNSVVKYSDIGTNTITLRCVTERVDCCGADNSTRADWFTPSGEVADTQFSRTWSGLGKAEGYVYILRRSSIDVADVQQGLYHCIIPAPNDDTSTLYVGVYIRNNIGKPTIRGITYYQLCPEMFTLTCTSTGGPATTVTWTLNGSEIAYDANHVLTQTVVNTRTAEYSNTLTMTGREPGNYQCTVSNARGSDTSQLLVVDNTVPTLPSCPSSPSTTTAQSTPSSDPSSPSQLPVAIAGAVVGLILCIILIVVLILALTVYKRRKGTWPWGKKTQDQYNLEQIDDTRSSVNQNQTKPSTGQTLTVQPGDDNIKNKSYLPSSQNNTMADSSDPTYSVVTDTTTPNVDSVPRETHIPMKSTGQPNSLFAHYENVQRDDSTEDSSSTKQESEAEDWPKPIFGPGYYNDAVRHSAQSDCRADPNTIKIVGPAGDVYAAVDKKTKKEQPVPYQEEL